MDAAATAALVLSFASAILFLVVGRTVQMRPASPEARHARGAFALWWYGLGGLTVVGLLLALPARIDLTLYLVFTVLLVGVLCAALAGLVHYLIFLYTSKRQALAWVSAGYGGLFLLFLEFIRESGPSGVHAGRFGPQVTYAHQVTSGPLYVAVIVLLLVPPVAAALAYLSLYWRVREPVLKRRILIVSTSIALWFGSSLLGLGQSTDNPPAWWILTSKVIALAAAGAILYAYTGLRPPAPRDAPPASRSPPEEQLYESDERGRALHVRPTRPALA